MWMISGTQIHHTHCKSDSWETPTFFTNISMMVTCWVVLSRKIYVSIWIWLLQNAYLNKNVSFFSPIGTEEKKFTHTKFQHFWLDRHQAVLFAAFFFIRKCLRYKSQAAILLLPSDINHCPHTHTVIQSVMYRQVLLYCKYRTYTFGHKEYNNISWWIYIFEVEILMILLLFLVKSDSKEVNFLKAHSTPGCGDSWQLLNCTLTHI